VFFILLPIYNFSAKKENMILNIGYLKESYSLPPATKRSATVDSARSPQCQQQRAQRQPATI
jgi:hypothetical protein